MAYGFYGKTALLVHHQIRGYHRPRQDKWLMLREIGKDSLSTSALMRLEWIIFYNTVGKKNASITATHFGVSRKTLHKYLARFDEVNLRSLEEHSRAPINRRTPTIRRVEEDRVIAIRKRSKCKWGKKKISKRYFKIHGVKISTHKVAYTINKYKLYPEPVKRPKQGQKPKKPRLRIHQFTKQNKLGFLWHTDSIIIYWFGQRRVIFTANEEQTKIAYARVYSSGTSNNAKDFLERLLYLSNNQVTNIHHDNGSEFAGEFEKACQQLKIPQIYSRVRRPKDNPSLERFNGVLQDEWLSVSDIGLTDITKANLDLTDWLVLYNSERPHESLDYENPLDYATANYPVSPMWAARTFDSIFHISGL